MPDKLIDIKNQVIEMPLLAAVNKIVIALPGNTNFLGLKAQLRNLEEDKHQEAITLDVYKVGLANKTRALDFFLEKLGQEDLEKVYKTFLQPGTLQLETNLNTILFVESTPTDQEHLQTNKEYSSVSKVIKASAFKNNFLMLNPLMASTIDDLIIGITEHHPKIIHFSGHAGKKGIVLNDDANNAQIISTNALSRLFEISKGYVGCVFLSACYSAEQAKIISQFTTYAIGMNCPIGDEAAILFSLAFYEALCNGSEINYIKAFQLALIPLMVKKTEESTTPEIWENGIKLNF
ncbi:MAG: CHAT domain-containing protein [Ginsengibacter sp.]